MNAGKRDSVTRKFLRGCMLCGDELLNIKRKNVPTDSKIPHNFYHDELNPPSKI
jgi:hypothetical protein